MKALREACRPPAGQRRDRGGGGRAAPPPVLDSPPLSRRALRVRGLVQGVGFRPFVYRLASELGLTGFVRNDAEGVAIEAQGGPAALEHFARRLRAEAPPLSRIDALEADERAPQREVGFAIQASGGGDAHTAIAPDTAVCADCLRELFDPADRRYRYAFINCTQCGPRYTITRGLPYDRPNTSMMGFAQCLACEGEYRAPASRRFHAQPNACPSCGPRLRLVDPQGAALPDEDPIVGAVTRLLRGGILAIKGLGGFHLACDARNPRAVAELRRRKDREEKPFALMVANATSAAAFARIDDMAAALLASRERPIVLLPKAANCDAQLAGVAPGIAQIGVMLPYAPLHYLLFHQAAGCPAGAGWLTRAHPLALVMTSANPAGEPLVIDNREALARLGGIADALLVHDRDILVRCDDSVLAHEAGDEASGEGTPAARPALVDPSRETARGCEEVSPARGASPRYAFVRRARGFTPAAIRLAHPGPPVLALGGYLKNTVCVTRGDEAFLSQHVGDLDNAATCAALEQTAAHLLAVLQVRPALVAHDLHPDFHSTRFAAQFARDHAIPALGVQHHHAHIAAVLAEHRMPGPALGLALDGVGLGEDGAAWGGELLRVDGASMRRLGHLRPLALPGGDRAAREPWRMAACALHALGRADAVAGRYDGAGATLVKMLARGLNCPATTSAGRWFDAAAGLLRVRETTSFEGQAAMLLEGLAAQHGAVAPLAGGFAIRADGTLDLLPLLARLADPIEPAEGAALFHATLAQALTCWAIAAAERESLSTVALGGGCFLNAILSRTLRARLRAAGLTVLQAAQAPPNDGGLALGQAWVAMHYSHTEH